MNKPKALAILGPTATSKTALAIKLAKDFDGEIINADAFQTYKEMNIGVNKPTKKELSQAKFHLVGEISVFDEWSIKEFQDKANSLIEQILKRKHLPIICGGSSLYVDALIQNYDLLTQKRTNEFDHLSVDELYKRLSKYSLEIANKNKNNHKRLARALEIYSCAKIDNPMKQKTNPKYNFKVILTNCDSREKLYDKINKRVDQMIKEGWEKEVQQLLKLKNIESTNAFKAIGYKEIALAVKNKTDIDTDKIKQNTRRYAKRQITWIKNHYKDFVLFDQHNYCNVSKQIKLWIK